MVLTEAFAAGTPVVASDIAGYRDVVSRRRRRRARAARRPDRAGRGAARPRARPARAAPRWPPPPRESAPRYAWPRVAAEVLERLRGRDRDARAAGSQTLPARLGLTPADGERVPAQRLPTLEPLPRAPRRRPAARRADGAPAGDRRRRPASPPRSRVIALQRIGVDRISHALVNAAPPWVLLGLGLMCFSMVLRAFAWHAILRAALPRARVRLRDALQGTFIGVLMSATLPARLGEPSRAFVVARRIGSAAPAPAGRARHDRLADAAQHPRARSCSAS